MNLQDKLNLLTSGVEIVAAKKKNSSDYSMKNAYGKICKNCKTDRAFHNHAEKHHVDRIRALDELIANPNTDKETALRLANIRDHHITLANAHVGLSNHFFYTGKNKLEAKDITENKPGKIRAAIYAMRNAYGRIAGESKNDADFHNAMVKHHATKISQLYDKMNSPKTTKLQAMKCADQMRSHKIMAHAHAQAADIANFGNYKTTASTEDTHKLYNVVLEQPKSYDSYNNFKNIVLKHKSHFYPFNHDIGSHPCAIPKDNSKNFEKDIKSNNHKII